MNKLPLFPTECNQTPFNSKISRVKIDGDKFSIDDDYFGSIISIDQTRLPIIKITVKRESKNSYLNGQISTFIFVVNE